MSDQTSELLTTGMHCRSCSMMVDMTVSEIDGVTAVQTDHATGKTIVSFNADIVDIPTIIEAIRGAGYDAEPVG
ncbi:MAG: heavy-metal-associated domain-containing protein [Coriobacteriia bacterium]|nr:heavy-metal-associated domain-containing protein [Coriobacteriia bacterium]